MHEESVAQWWSVRLTMESSWVQTPFQARFIIKESYILHTSLRIDISVDYEHEN